MKKPRLLRDVGYVYDLMFIFYYHYNRDIVEKQSPTKDLTPWEGVMEGFEPVSDRLFVFFHALKNEKCYFSKYFFNHKKRHFTTDYNFDYLLELLADRRRILKTMTMFYFHDAPKETVVACGEDPTVAFDLIKSSSYSYMEKSKLYEFFIDPDDAISHLREELITAEQKLSMYYRENEKILEQAHEEIDTEELPQFYKTLGVQDLISEELCVVLCLLNKYCIGLFGTEEHSIAILGYKSLTIKQYLENEKISITTEELGSAIGDKYRAKILDLLLERGEMTCKELEQHFAISASTSYHHLSTMLKYGVIETKVVKKTNYYRINHAYFEAAIEHLKKYTLPEPDEKDEAL